MRKILALLKIRLFTHSCPAWKSAKEVCGGGESVGRKSQKDSDYNLEKSLWAEATYSCIIRLVLGSIHNMIL